MDRKTLLRLRAMNETRQMLLQARHSQLARGISDGMALAKKYTDLDCGLGPRAEFGLAHVARSLGVIDRGVAALREQEASVASQIRSIEAAQDRLAELQLEMEIEQERRRADIELIDVLERHLGPLKAGVSDAPDADDGLL